jgi:hypothetical protein
MPEETPSPPALRSLLASILVTMLAALVIFIAHDAINGAGSGGAPIGGVAAASALAGERIFERYGDLATGEKYAALAVLTVMMALPAIVVLHLVG